MSNGLLDRIRLAEQRTADEADAATRRDEVVALKLRGNRDHQLKLASEIQLRSMERQGDANLRGADWDSFKAAVHQAEVFDRQAALAERVATEKRTKAEVHASLSVKSEPRTYGPSNPANSYFLDLAAASDPSSPGAPQARERLERYSAELREEAKRGSKEGARAARLAGEEHRGEARDRAEREVRAMTSGSASGGAFVAPAFLVPEFATYRSAARSFTDACRQAPLPAYGLAVSVPAFQSPAQAGAQPAETSGAYDQDPTSGYITADLVTVEGAVVVSQQLRDRGGALGLTVDQIIAQQLQEQLDAATDLYAIGQATADAAEVTDATSLTTAKLFADLAQARASLADSAGARLRGTHLFSTTDLYAWASSQVDTQKRPIIVPATVPAAGDDPADESDTGVVMPGGLRWRTDDNIPAVSGNTQLLVARPSEVVAFVGEPTTFTAAQANPLSTSLSVVVGLRSYVAVLPRYAKAVAVVTGDAYPTSLN